MLYVSEGLQGVAKPSTLLLTGPPNKKWIQTSVGKCLKQLFVRCIKTQVFRVVLP